MNKLPSYIEDDIYHQIHELNLWPTINTIRGFCRYTTTCYSFIVDRYDRRFDRGSVRCTRYYGGHAFNSCYVLRRPFKSHDLVIQYDMIKRKHRSKTNPIKQMQYTIVTLS